MEDSAFVKGTQHRVSGTLKRRPKDVGRDDIKLLQLRSYSLSLISFINT